MIEVLHYYCTKLTKTWSVLKLMDGFTNFIHSAVRTNTVSNLCAKQGFMDIRMQNSNNNNLIPIGDAAFHEEMRLQDRIVRILSYTDAPTEVIFLYFNDQFPDQPPSFSLFEDENLSDCSSLPEEEGTCKGQHDMFPKIVRSRIVDQATNSYYVEDIITHVYLPSEEFSEVVVINRKKRFWSRIWRWFKRKSGCI